MFGVLDHACTKRRLVGEFAGMAVEVGSPPLGERPGDLTTEAKIMPPITAGQHRERRVVQAGDRKPVRGSAKRDLRISGSIIGFGHDRARVHAAALPSTTSAATSSAVTTSSTAWG